VGLDLHARDIRLSFGLPGGASLEALDVPEFRVAADQAVGITGPSGSGKTSLLHVLTGIERPQARAVVWGGIDLVSLSESARDRWRRTSVGFVFQEFHLWPGLSVIGNVLLPATFRHVVVPPSLKTHARALLRRVGLGDRDRPVTSLSRGEMQRVAVARALLFAPAVVVADEPTASLDAQSASDVGDLLLDVCRDSKATLLVVTHDRPLLDRLDVVFPLENGRLGPPALTASR
jgi:putative ABC transport system ATP-binding protein